MTHLSNKLIRAWLVKYLYGLCLHGLEERLYSDMIIRWFVGCTLFEVPPDHTTLERFELWLKDNQHTGSFDGILRRIRNDYPDEHQTQIGDTYGMRARAARENLGLAALSVAAIFLFVSSVDAVAVQARLQGRVAERFGAGVLMGLGAMFFLRAVAELFDGAAGMAEFGVLVADGLTTPFWILGGLTLWRKQPLGYVSGAGLLFQASMLFVGLLAFFILQPFVAGVPFPIEYFIVILAMGLVVFIPFGLFVREMIQAKQA